MLLLNTLLTGVVPLALCLGLSLALGRGRLQGRYLFVAVTLLGALGGILFAVFGASTVQTWTEWAIGASGLHALLPYTDAFAEELGKALILLALLTSRTYRSPIDGLLFGLAAGAGFAAVENIAYSVVAYGGGGWQAFVDAALLRVPASIVIHGGATALVGAGLAEARWDRRGWVVFLALPALLVAATFVHGSWNVLISDAFATRSFASAAGAFGLLAAMVLFGAALLAYGMRAERAAIASELGEEVDAGRLDPRVLARVTGPHTAVSSSLLKRRSRRRAVQHLALVLAYELRRVRGGEGSRDEAQRLARELEERVSFA